MRDKDIEIICGNLDYLELPKNAAVMRYGEEGDQFYLLLQGKVSIWVPVTFKDMKEPISKLKDMVNQEYRQLKELDELVKKHKPGEYNKLT